MFNLFKRKEKPELLEWTLAPHTVIMTVGPTYCGKSTVTKKAVEEIRLAYPQSNIVYLSSDEERRSLLNDSSIDRHSPEMKNVSKAAFDVLITKLKASLSYPQSLKNHLIIIDSTALSESFRTQVREICKEYQYETALLLFSYKSRKEYLKYVPESSVSITERAVKQFNTRVLPQLKSKEYSQIQRVKQANTKLILRFDSSYKELYLKSLLPATVPYVVIGDVHCNLDLLKKAFNALEEVHLVKDTVFVPYSKPIIILNGDWIDKRVEQLKETIEFLYHNKDQILFVRGNHESFCYQYLKDKINDVEGLRFKYFNSIPLLQKDETLKQQFFELYERSQPFYIHRDFVVHHSPCPTQYVGKMDNKSLKKQIKNRYPQRGESSLGDYTLALENHLSFIKEETNGPYIVNGHISIERPLKQNLHILLDTRAEDDKALSCAIFKDDRVRILSFHGDDQSTELPLLFKRRLGTREFTRKENKIIKSRMNRNRFAFLMPTISPADSTETELESLREAIMHYYNKGVTQLVMQPKRMGSNCTFYLSRNKDCYATTRAGYLLREDQCSINDLLNEWKDKVFSLPEFKNLDTVIINGELEPWSLLAKDYLDKQFNRVYFSKKEIAQFLLDHRFTDHLELANNQAKLLKSTERALKLLNPHFVDPVDQLADLDQYQKELASYVKETPPAFYPYLVLKTIDQEGNEAVLPYNNQQSWTLFNSDEQIHCFSLSPEALEETIGSVYEVFNNWTSNSQAHFGLDSLEGVVIKPLEVLGDQLIGIKVRTPSYLQLVYGPSYERNLSEFLFNKGVAFKRRISLKQWKLNQMFLQVPFEGLDENPDAIQVVSELLIQEKELERLDPRL